VGTCSEFPHAAHSALTDDLVDARGAVRSTRTATEKPRCVPADQDVGQQTHQNRRCIFAAPCLFAY